MKFVHLLKERVKRKGKYFPKFSYNYANISKAAFTAMVLDEQRLHFSDVFTYFKTPTSCVKGVPNIVKQINCFRDESGLLRVKSKLAHIGKSMTDFPILLPKDGCFTKLLIYHCHARKLKHAGKYTVLSELRKHFYIPSCFSTVKKILRSCFLCRRFNNRPVNVNQSSYRNFRTDPSTIPFRTVFIDYLGPFNVKISGTNSKIYLLLFTCLWSRGISLQICLDMSQHNFMRAFQMHVFKYGLPSLCLSDSGTQIVSGTKIITDHLSTQETVAYLSENGIKTLEFSQYAKGCNKLGSLVEICVKLVKRLIFGSMKRNILSYSDFEFMVSEVNHLVNRRPICFKDALRDGSTKNEIPVALTPEIIIHGHELVSVNIIPELEQGDEWQSGRCPSVMFQKLTEIRDSLHEIYSTEFLPKLIDQATCVTDRYAPVKHDKLSVGDIVIMKESMTKRANMPLAIVKQVTTNDQGEVVSVKLLKGATRETVNRHVSSVIPVLNVDKFPDACNTSASSPRRCNVPKKNPKRAAAEACVSKCRKLREDGLV